MYCWGYFWFFDVRIIEILTVDNVVESIVDGFLIYLLMLGGMVEFDGVELFIDLMEFKGFGLGYF